ncbi:MAG TPA: terpene synthase family protein [Micromonosporaceae bacterium]
MTGTWPGHAQIRDAAEFGRVCAVAAAGQRDLAQYAQKYPDLFSAKPFDATLFGTVSLANAFSAPGLDAQRLRMANRASLWGFGVDWQIDYLATSPAEVAEVCRRCLAVAGGEAAEEGDPLTRFLAELRAELAATPGFARVAAAWQEELRRMLDAMALEFRWRAEVRAGGTPPSLEDYLDNADNLGSSFVDLSHWLYTTDSGSPEDLDEVVAASRVEQRVIRLLNDLGTYERDLAWGDLNALMLGASRDEVSACIDQLVDECRRLTDRLSARQPELASFLTRQVGFCMGFYRVTDYWGAL